MVFPLPDGRQGLTPQLGLSYGAPHSNGIFGQGWALTGLLVIANQAQADFLFADMTGDGLRDQVMIRPPRLVANWPNLGHGQFGRPVLMENASKLAGVRNSGLIA